MQEYKCKYDCVIRLTYIKYDNFQQAIYVFGIHINIVFYKYFFPPATTPFEAEPNDFDQSKELNRLSGETQEINKLANENDDGVELKVKISLKYLIENQMLSISIFTTKSYYPGDL